MLSSGTDSGSPANGVALRTGPTWGFPGSYKHQPSMWGWVQTFTSYFDVYQGDFDPFTRVISDSCTRCHPRSMPKKLKMPPTGKAGCWGEEAIIITADMCVMCLYLSIFPSIHPSFHKEFTYRFTYSDIDLHKDLHMPIYPSIHPSLYIHLYISIYLSIYLSIHPSIHPSIIYLSKLLYPRVFNFQPWPDSLCFSSAAHCAASPDSGGRS